MPTQRITRINRRSHHSIEVHYETAKVELISFITQPPFVRVIVWNKQMDDASDIQNHIEDMQKAAITMRRLQAAARVIFQRDFEYWDSTEQETIE